MIQFKVNHPMSERERWAIALLFVIPIMLLAGAIFGYCGGPSPRHADAISRASAGRLPHGPGNTGLMEIRPAGGSTWCKSQSAGGETPPGLQPISRASGGIALLAARIAANEDSRPLRPVSDGGTAGALTPDWLGVLQVAHNVSADHGWSMIETLRRMAPRVAGVRASTVHAHEVARALPARLVAIGRHRYEAPAAWLQRDGDWNLYAENWIAAHAALRRAMAEGFDPPCPGRPIAEGSPHDAKFARARGLVRLPCGERLQFWARPDAGMVAERVP